LLAVSNWVELNVVTISSLEFTRTSVAIINVFCVVSKVFMLEGIYYKLTTKLWLKDNY